MHGPDDATRESRINPRRFGERTWFDMPGTSSRCREAGADEFARTRIDQSLANYWRGRV
jgi:hypothetical protein